MFYIVVYNPKHILTQDAEMLCKNIQSSMNCQAWLVKHMDDDDSGLYLINSSSGTEVIKKEMQHLLERMR